MGKTFDVKDKDGHWRYWVEHGKIEAVKRLADYKNYTRRDEKR